MTSLKIKHFSITKKHSTNSCFCMQHIKLGFICFYPIFFNSSLFRGSVLTNLLLKVKGPLYDDSILMVAFSAYFRNSQYQNLHIFIPLLPFACVDDSNRLKLSKRRNSFCWVFFFVNNFTKLISPKL